MRDGADGLHGELPGAIDLLKGTTPSFTRYEQLASEIGPR